MPYAGQTVENPVTGERMTFLRTSADTGGEHVLIELRARPGAVVAAAHVHPSQTETFTIVSGTFGAKVGRSQVEARSGETLVVEPGVAHKWWNAGDDELVFRCEVRPALAFESLIETMFGLAEDGKTNRKGMPNPFRLAVIAQHHFADVNLPLVPAWLQRSALAVGAGLGRALGYEPTYAPAGLPAAATAEAGGRAGAAVPPPAPPRVRHAVPVAAAGARLVAVLVAALGAAACGGGDGGGGALGGSAETRILAQRQLDEAPAGPVTWVADEIRLPAGRRLEHAHELAFVYATEGPHRLSGPLERSLAPEDGAPVPEGATHVHEASPDAPSTFWEIRLAAPDAGPPPGAEDATRMFAGEPLAGIPPRPLASFVWVRVPAGGGETTVHTHPGPELIHTLSGRIEYENALVGALALGPGRTESIPPGTPVQKRNPYGMDAVFLSWFVVDPEAEFAPPAEFER